MKIPNVHRCAATTVSTLENILGVAQREHPVLIIVLPKGELEKSPVRQSDGNMEIGIL